VLNIIIVLVIYALGQSGILLEYRKFVFSYFSIESYAGAFLLCNMTYLVGTTLASIHNKWWDKRETIKPIEVPYFKGVIVLLALITGATLFLFFNQ
jgi:hypothetical protein